jgi:hypothetical protein
LIVGAVIVAAATPSKRFKDWRRVIMPGLSRQFVSILGQLTEKPAFWNYGLVKTTLDLPDELIIAISCAPSRC